MSQNDDNSWVFDSLVAFLNGPIWNAPLQSFIEEKSLIFEPNDTQHEGYKAIFDEFKNLVDFMLGNFMEDIGISSEQFQEACTEGKKYHMSFDNTLFEQIWAANDFKMFVKMMTQRNVELQLQALELIEKKYGIMPQSFIPKTDDKAQVNADRESKLEKEILEEVSKRFVEDQSGTSTVEIENLMEQKPILQEQLKKTIESIEEPLAESCKQEDETSLKKQANVIEVNKEIDALELKKRQEYLRAQRDKLVAMKKEARQKQLNGNSSKAKNNRPKSAKAAEAVLTGGSIGAGQLQLRKTLAERLKAEVVDKNQK
ncbi:cilia- and flagella-associated protein 36 [Anthonomus grandis grandis]|uniref:cilia- and flagella-associated protein 36 n=1 Tax=Anthonomus grandis grandis TaxID=2921223 RepID=UPI00216650A9|nr:cilia- and flagella-associated protein 36 [Anthonomus grandis grandis]